MPQLSTETLPITNAADYLTDYINNQAASPSTAQWFKRETSGYGTGIAGINLASELETRTLPDAVFPDLLINRTSHNLAHQQLIDDFLDWQAPWLLLLSTLDSDMRRHFEQAARKQALIVQQQYKLYPEIIDESAINTARVEAILRRNEIQPEEEEDKILSTFYLELYPISAE